MADAPVLMIIDFESVSNANAPRKSVSAKTHKKLKIIYYNLIPLNCC